MNNPDGHVAAPDIDPNLETFKLILEMREAADEAERLVRAVASGLDALEDTRIALTLAREALIEGVADGKSQNAPLLDYL